LDFVFRTVYFWRVFKDLTKKYKNVTLVKFFPKWQSFAQYGHTAWKWNPKGLLPSISTVARGSF
jgi:hypothetical protein